MDLHYVTHIVSKVMHSLVTLLTILASDIKVSHVVKVQQLMRTMSPERKTSMTNLLSELCSLVLNFRPFQKWSYLV